jgi:hypothetical protein
MGGRVFRAKKTSETLKVLGFVAAVVVLIILVYIGLGNLSSTQAEKQMTIARDAIIKAAVQCYALESQFPPSLQYMVDNYGLVLDEDRFIYHYRAIGSNMFPEIKVFENVPRGGG